MPLDAADIAMFFDEDMPGYALASIGGAEIPGLFRSPYAESFGLAAGSAPVFRCASADVASVAQDAAATINGTAYTVAEIKPDGTGMTLLILEAA